MRKMVHLSVYIKLALLAVGVPLSTQTSFAQVGVPAITISSAVPDELNPPFSVGPPAAGGAPNATPEQAAAFSWQEFIAVNWPAGPQEGTAGQRDTPSTIYKFGDPAYTGPLVWETFRGKVEIFPGNANQFKYSPPPGYPGAKGDPSKGYDALPRYNYSTPIAACDQSQANDPTPWINLDETDQITLDNMYAGLVAANMSLGNSSPQLIRFLAKANRAQYVYVVGNSSTSDPALQWWNSIPADVVQATQRYLATNQASPPAGSSTLVSLPYGTIEAKAGWRVLNPLEATSGRFHTQTVRFYERASDGIHACFHDAVWGLVALHIIQKTPSAPFFIYATFEQADNILTSNGDRVEDADGNLIAKFNPAAATSPQVCMMDPRPPSSPPPAGGEVTSKLGSVSMTGDPATCQPLPTASYCGAPGSQLYLRNAMPSPPSSNSEPSAGYVCINKRENAIPDYVITANTRAHATITAYLNQNGIKSAPWLFYKLVNVQYFPYDKVITTVTPNGSLYNGQPPYTAQNPAPSSYYQANIVVETNRSLQLFSGGLSPNISTDWNQDGTPHKNTYYGGHFYNMGGCMGCHGSQGQNPKSPTGIGQAGDFSVILARGNVAQPEPPSLVTSQGMTPEPRNRSLTNQ